MHRFISHRQNKALISFHGQEYLMTRITSETIPRVNVFGLSFLGSHRGAVPEMIFADRLVPLAKLHLVNFITDAHMWFLQEGCPFLELIIAMHLEGKSLDMVKILSFIYCIQCRQLISLAVANHV